LYLLSFIIQFFGKKIKASSPSLSTEATPDHHTRGVLDGLQDHLVLVTAHGLVAPHCSGPGPCVDPAEHGLVTVHDILPLGGILVLVLSSKCQPLLPHGQGQQWLLSSPTGGQVRLLLQAILDGADQNISPPCNLIF
jgi:hypothetical protein